MAKTYDIYKTVTHFHTVVADTEDEALMKGFEAHDKDKGIFDSNEYVVVKVQDKKYNK